MRSSTEILIKAMRIVSSGNDGVVSAATAEAAQRLEEQSAKIKRLRDGIAKQNLEIEQTCGKVLDYPWFKDDQKNFPGATEKDGVCVGDHVAETIAAELARKYTEAMDRIKHLKREIELFREHADYGDMCLVEAILKGEEIGRKEKESKPCIYCMKVECECSDFDISADMGAKG